MVCLFGYWFYLNRSVEFIWPKVPPSVIKWVKIIWYLVCVLIAEASEASVHCVDFCVCVDCVCAVPITKYYWRIFDDRMRQRKEVNKRKSMSIRMRPRILKVMSKGVEVEVDVDVEGVLEDERWGLNCKSTNHDHNSSRRHMKSNHITQKEQCCLLVFILFDFKNPAPPPALTPAFIPAPGILLPETCKNIDGCGFLCEN